MRARGSCHGTLAAILDCDNVGRSQVAQLYLDGDVGNNLSQQAHGITLGSDSLSEGWEPLESTPKGI